MAIRTHSHRSNRVRTFINLDTILVCLFLFQSTVVLGNADPLSKLSKLNSVGYYNGVQPRSAQWGKRGVKREHIQCLC